jgi:two-component system sensor histidine kinase DegS
MSKKAVPSDKQIHKKLESILHQMLNMVDSSRNDIYDIAEDCHQQCAAIKTMLEEIALETNSIIVKVDECEKLEKMARIRLRDVSQHFKSYSEMDIKKAYEKAQELQSALQELRQQEIYLRKKRDELSRQLKKFEQIADKADSYLRNTNLALRMLQGNIERITDTLEDAHRKQQLGTWLVETLEAERRKIARELHDGPAQSLASMLIRLDLMEYLFREDVEYTSEELNSIKQMGRESLSDIRRIMFDLKPSAVQEVGLIATLKDYIHDYESKYNFEIELVIFGKEPKCALPLEIALFRLAQESITNVRKHSGVNKALLKVENTGSKVVMVIKDTGCGFDVEGVMNSKRESYGIIGMQERAELIGGQMQIISRIGEGTQVIVEVPIEGEENSGKD